MMNKSSFAGRLLTPLATSLLILAAANQAWAGDPAKGKEKSTVCAACHGVDGNSAAPDFPKLAGQYPDYIIVALQHYKSGKRKNPMMAPMTSNLSPEDIADIAAYFASQTTGVSNKY
jgi:cytochrome c553